MECKIWVQFTNNYCCPGEIVPILHMCQWMHISGCMFNDGNVFSLLVDRFHLCPLFFKITVLVIGFWIFHNLRHCLLCAHSECSVIF